MRNFSIILLSTLLFACGESLSYKMPDRGTIETAIEKGEFTEASKMIGLYLACDTLTPLQRYEMNFLLEWMDRVKDDFDQKDSSVIAYIKKHYPDATEGQISEWEKSNALENMVIDGQKRYFSLAGRNLFRIDSLAEKHFQYKEGEKPDSLTRLLSNLIPQLVKEAEDKKSVYVNPVKMKIKYTLSVKPNEIPEGESVRVWMPYPRTDTKAHTDIKLLSTTQPLYIISPDSYAHKSIYMEGKAVKDEPVIFGFELIYTSFAQVHLFAAQNIKDYDTTGQVYKEFTRESGQHIVFSDNIKAAVKEAIGEESNPYLKARKIYEWIDSNFPWASAREYSTIENIPEYVLKNRHGDCGQVSLLFITMARCAGVPAKWQSGWMLHPGNINLHDWAEVWFEGVGWVPVDQSFGRVKSSKGDDNAFYFFTKGLDPYRLIVNDNISGEFFPAKIYSRSETVDFQRGEVEWRGENLYFGRWRYKMEVEYIK